MTTGIIGFHSKKYFTKSEIYFDKKEENLEKVKHLVIDDYIGVFAFLLIFHLISSIILIVESLENRFKLCDILLILPSLTRAIIFELLHSSRIIVMNLSRKLNLIVNQIKIELNLLVECLIDTNNPR